MKKNHLSAILLALIVILPVFAGQDNPPQDVPIASNPDKGGIFRAPALVPISCLYSDGVLTFTFSADLGTVECEVIRQSDLEVYDATSKLSMEARTASMSPPMQMTMRLPSRCRTEQRSMENIR